MSCQRSCQKNLPSIGRPIKSGGLPATPRWARLAYVTGPNRPWSQSCHGVVLCTNKGSVFTPPDSWLSANNLMQQPSERRFKLRASKGHFLPLAWEARQIQDGNSRRWILSVCEKVCETDALTLGWTWATPLRHVGNVRGTVHDFFISRLPSLNVVTICETPFFFWPLSQQRARLNCPFNETTESGKGIKVSDIQPNLH